MADVLLSIEEASKQLQLSKDQITEMVKKGLLRGFLDQKTYKFRPPDIEAFKKKLADGVTAVAEGAKKDATSKIDLTEIESDSGVEDSDQTSVLAPTRPSEPQATAPEKPVFKFGDKDIREDQEPALEEGDQTSLLVPPAPSAQKGKPAAPVFEEGDQTSLLVPPAPSAAKGKPSQDFAKRDLKLPDEGESVLVADESESSMDILEVAEESSESGSSASRIAFSDEVTSGDEIEAAPAGAKAAAKPPRKTGEPSTDKVVSDILGPAPEESDEALETLDVEQPVEAKEPSSTGVEAAVEPERAAPAADEHETVGIPAADETKVAMGADETKAALGEAEAVETAGVDGAVAAALQEQAGAEEPEAPEQAAIIPGGWETAQPWPIGNALLIAATVVLIVAGALIVCQAFNVDNSLTQQIASALAGRH